MADFVGKDDLDLFGQEALNERVAQQDAPVAPRPANMALALTVSALKSRR